MATSREDPVWRYELVMAMMENFHISLVGHESALPNGFFWRGCPATNHVTVSVVREMIDAIIETQGNLSLVAGQYNLIWEQIVRLLILVIHSQDDSNDIILTYARKWIKEEERKRSEQAIIAQDCRVRFLIEAIPLQSPRRLRLAYISELLRLGYSSFDAALALAKFAARKMAQRDMEILEKGSGVEDKARTRPNYTLIRNEMLEWMLDYYEQRGEFRDLGPFETEWWLGLREAHESHRGLLRFEQWLYSADTNLGSDQFFFQPAQL